MSRGETIGILIILLIVVALGATACMMPKETPTAQSNPTDVPGWVTLSVASEPDGPVKAGTKSVVLAKFRFEVGNEPVIWLAQDVHILKRDGASWLEPQTAKSDLSNIRLMTSSGEQVGPSIDPSNTGVGSGQCQRSDDSIVCRFGDRLSPMRYQFAANAKLEVMVVADVGTSTGMTTVSVALMADTDNLRGATSGRVGSLASAVGPTRLVQQQ